MCSNEHSLYKCKNFSNLSVPKRKEFVKTNKLCENCLWNHVGKCNSKFKCQMCNLLHKMLLCEIKKWRNIGSNSFTSTNSHLSESIDTNKNVSLLSNRKKNKCVLLNTAMIFVEDSEQGKKKSNYNVCVIVLVVKIY